MLEHEPDNVVRGHFPAHRPFDDRFEDQLSDAPQRIVDQEALEREPTLDELRFRDRELFQARAMDVALHAAILKSDGGPKDLTQAAVELRDQMWSRLTGPEKARVKSHLNSHGYESPED